MKYEAQLKTWALEKALQYPDGTTGLEIRADQLYKYAYSPDLDLLDSFKHAMELLASVGNAKEIIKEMAFLLEQAQHQLGVSVVTFTPVEAATETEPCVKLAEKH